jgi:hypothetical protein
VSGHALGVGHLRLHFGLSAESSDWNMCGGAQVGTFKRRGHGLSADMATARIGAWTEPDPKLPVDVESLCAFLVRDQSASVD